MLDNTKSLWRVIATRGNRFFIIVHEGIHQVLVELGFSAKCKVECISQIFSLFHLRELKEILKPELCRFVSHWKRIVDYVTLPYFDECPNNSLIRVTYTILYAEAVIKRFPRFEQCYNIRHIKNIKHNIDFCRSSCIIIN